jgi:AbrB family looped-hinge helix DNA binding protein
MPTTIDKAGRIVIPADIRRRAGLSPGTEVEIVLDDLSVRVQRVVSPPDLVKENGRWIVRPTVAADRRTDIDVADLVRQERDRSPW